MSLILDGSNGITFPNSSTQAVGFYGFKNRIINGAMTIAQYSTSSQTATGYQTVDRWAYYSGGISGKFNWQQNAGSVTPPVGFSNYLGFTSTSAYSVGATDRFILQQSIEGFNTSDLMFGTASAKTVTLSAWVYSSLTGTFGGTLQNYASTRSYPFTYSIPVANTWTQISITIAGDTGGTWVGASNAASFAVIFSLGAGSTLSGTAGSWASANYVSATGATSVVGTNGATFYITGVQLEAGSTATSFDYRPYGTELALCQRYYETYALFYNNESLVGMCESTTAAYTAWKFVVTKRAAPTCATFGTVQVVNAVGSGLSLSSFSFTNTNPDQARINAMTNSASLVAGNATNFYTTTSTSPYGGFTASAEL